MATRYTQPQAGPFEIDWGNPVTKGLFALLNPAAGPTNLVSQTPLGTLTHTLAKGVGSNGVNWTNNGSTATGYTLTPPTGMTAGSVLLLGIANPPGSGSNNPISISQGAGDGTLYAPYVDGNIYSGLWANARYLSAVAPPFSITKPAIFIAVGSTAASTHAMYMNGVLLGSSNSTFAYDSIFAVGAGDPPGLSYALNGGMALAAYFNRVLSTAEIKSLSANPWQLFKDPRRVLRAASAGGAAVNPAAGAIALTGYSPSLAQTANQSLAAGVGTLVLTGYAPSISQPIAVAPGTGTVAITGYAPALAQTANQSVAPAVGPLSITGYAPSVSQSAAGAVHPGVGAIAITGYAPTISQPIAVAPGAGAIALTGYSPSVTQPHAVAAGVGSLVLTGYAPTTAQTASQSIAPAVGSVALTGYAPSVTQAVASQILIPGVGTLAITGYPPLVAQAAAIEFGSPLIVTPTPRNWISSSEPRNWIASNPPRNWIAKRDIT